jgi:hypothetical protein
MGQSEFSLFMAQGWMRAFAGMTTVDSTKTSAGIVIPAASGNPAGSFWECTIARLQALRFRRIDFTHFSSPTELVFPTIFVIQQCEFS